MTFRGLAISVDSEALRNKSSGAIMLWRLKDVKARESCTNHTLLYNMLKNNQEAVLVGRYDSLDLRYIQDVIFDTYAEDNVLWHVEDLKVFTLASFFDTPPLPNGSIAYLTIIYRRLARSNHIV